MMTGRRIKTAWALAAVVMTAFALNGTAEDTPPKPGGRRRRVPRAAHSASLRGCDFFARFFCSKAL